MTALSSHSGNTVDLGSGRSAVATLAVDSTGTPASTGGGGGGATAAGTATLSSVNDSATSVTLLALNTARLGATITNTSSAKLYVKFGAAASLTSHVVGLNQYDYYEVPFNYTGLIAGIWESDPGDGVALMTEYTA